jgi:hypothetical protein
MFIELMPLLGERTVMLIVARIDQNRIRVNVIPQERGRMKTPHCARHSASAAHQRNLGVYVEDNLRLQHTLEDAKAEMDAAAKTARERASGKAGQTAKKTELQGGQQTDSNRDRGPGGSGKSPVTSSLPTIHPGRSTQNATRLPVQGSLSDSPCYQQLKFLVSGLFEC